MVKKIGVLVLLFFAFRVVAQPYCTPVVAPLSGNYGISNVTLNTINNNTATQQGYVDYSGSISTTVNRNGTYQISVTAGQTMQTALFWVDWNQDFDFNDVGEEYFIGTHSGGGVTTRMFTVPPTALLGTTRIRVSSGEISIMVDPGSYPCGSPDPLPNGDVEDYALVISEVPMVFDSCTTVQGIYHNCLLAPQNNVLIHCVKVYTSFTLNPLTGTAFTFNTFGTNAPTDISKARLFSTGLSPLYSSAVQFGTDFISPTGAFTINGNVPLDPGVNYFWLEYDISGTTGNFIDASFTSVTINSVSHAPIVQDPGAGFQVGTPANYCNTKRNNIWLFGNRAGIDFNCNPPKAIINSRMNFGEGSGCMSDNTGSLLFSTAGNSVNDKTNLTMPLGMINAAGQQPAQPVIIVPDPANAKKYYLFTTPYPTGNDSLYYSVVDMSLPGNGTVVNPLGNMVAGKIKIGLIDSSMQSITAVPHCNRKDYWVIAKRFNTNLFYVYNVSAAGVSAPVISNIGKILTDNSPSNGHGQLKASPNGKKLAFTYFELSGSELQLFDFDNTTGIISNYIPLPLPDWSFGTSFSPDNTKLYVSGIYGTFIFQYDICAGNAAAIQASKYTIAVGAPTSTHIREGMQLAPDGKIYGVNHVQDSLHIIQNPNLPGALCSYIRNGFSLGGNGISNNFSLPNFIDADFLDCNSRLTADKLGFTSSQACLGDTTFFTDTSTAIQTHCFSDPRTFSWYFDDPSSGSLNTSTAKNPKHIFTQSGVFTITFVVSEGCQTDTIYKNVLVDSLPVVTSSPAQTICAGNSVTLTAGGASSYLWSPSGGLSSTTGNSLIANPSMPVSYTIAGTDGNGCSDTTTIMVNVNQLPSVVASPATVICAGDSVTLTATGAINYSWSAASGLNSTTGSVVIANPAGPLTYTVTGTDLNGCSDTAQISIIVNQLPVVNVSGLISICDGDSTTLTASGANGYSWSPQTGLNSSTGTTVLVTTTLSGTSYTVTGTDANGCVNTSAVTITINQIPIADAGLNDTICLGQGSVLNASGGISYLWSTGQSTSSITIVPTGRTTYSVIVSIGPCMDIDSTLIVVLQNPVANAGAGITIINGTTATLSASGGGSYSWSPSLGLSCLTCQHPIASPQMTTKYYLTITDSNGCISMDSVLITVENMPCNSDIFIPNAFSPNGDGQNDVLFANIKCIKNFSIQIFDRWGNLVFETTDITKGWDGYYHGEIMNAAVFAYIVTATLVNKDEITKKGNVSLIR